MQSTESDSLSNPANPPRPLATLEQSLNYAAELLCCAAATAYESGDRLSGIEISA
ncbi:hypothetical protein [Pseudomonas sp. CDFA 610]|uniref:hypothetical protein n=1 Tax=Pseudomonas sp. CDFA 610 TaxID=2829825 RepID=UPI001E41322E|nr:hypothetical protein [Pseudomonas sp. CDFA 610]MCD5985928.1 hypothetical protein [Pseudomonas sp. CDFA 610]